MRTLLVLALLVCAAGAAHGETQSFLAYDFQFEDGTTLPELRIAYEMHGSLAPGRDNAILLVPGASADLHAYDSMIGPGKTWDTNRYAVITTDPIGGGESSSPKDGLGQDFPRYTIRDVMAAQHALATRGLELGPLRAVGGVGLGALVALEWAIHHPEMVRNLILLSPSTDAEPNLRLSVDLMTSVIALDPDWQGGRYSHNPVEGLRLTGMLHFPWEVSDAYIARVSERRLARELEDSARAFGNWDANGLVLRFAAVRAHDVGAPFGGDMQMALSQIRAPVLILASATDRLFGLDGARRIRDGVKTADYVEIESDLGHRALTAPPGTAEADTIDRRIRKFLARVE
jgi:homoserine O-acetyltransferase